MEYSNTMNKRSLSEGDDGNGKDHVATKQLKITNDKEQARLPNDSEVSKSVETPGATDPVDSQVNAENLVNRFKSVSPTANTKENEMNKPPKGMSELERLLIKVRNAPKIKTSEEDQRYVYLKSIDREHIYKMLHEPAIIGLNMFKRIVKLKLDGVLLVILNKTRYLTNLKECLAKEDVLYFDSNPTEIESDQYFAVIADYSVDNPTDSTIRKALVDQNGALMKENSFTITNNYKRAPSMCIIKMIDFELYKNLINKGVVHLLSNTVTVRAFDFKMKSCNRCCKLGCTGSCTVTICIKCANTGHTFEACSAKRDAPPCCFNCKVRGERNHRHWANAQYCPYKLDAVHHAVVDRLKI